MIEVEQVIKYAKMLNFKNLSALRSGNISVRYKNGFLITPSGVKYSQLETEDVVFVSLDGKFESLKQKPSSEWRIHKDIYVNKKEAKFHDMMMLIDYVKEQVKKKFNGFE